MMPRKARETGPLWHLRLWLARHPELPQESAAGFAVAAQGQGWDTDAGWQTRWAAWLQGPPGAAREKGE